MMAWKSQELVGKELAPLRQSVLLKSAEESVRDRDQIKKEISDAFQIVCEMWGDMRGWWMSGSAALFWETQKFRRLPRDLDVVVLSQEGLVERMIERGKENGMFLFSRLPRGFFESLKLWEHEVYESYLPYSLDDFMKGHTKKNGNLVFSQVDNQGQIESRESMFTRIRIYPHYTKEIKGVEYHFSAEDNLKVDPSHLSGGEPIYKMGTRRSVYGVDLRYLWKVYRLKTSRYQREPERTEAKYAAALIRHHYHQIGHFDKLEEIGFMPRKRKIKIKK
jgi:hypothetical protein